MEIPLLVRGETRGQGIGSLIAVKEASCRKREAAAKQGKMRAPAHSVRAADGDNAMMKHALSLVTMPLGRGTGEFWLSAVHANPAGDQWQFCLCGAGKTFIARFVYHDEVVAQRAALELGAALQGAVFVTTEE